MYLSNYFVVLFLTTVLRCVQSRLTLKGVTIESPPFVMKVNGNHFEGFGIDLINELSKIGDFNYTLYTTPDNKYGSQDQSGRPSGLINEIFMKRADFTIADLTKSQMRDRYVDFTDSFMKADLTALINKKNKGNISSFEDLLNQQEITYGTLREGETYRFMSMSADQTILGLQSFIFRNSYLLVNSRQEGVEKAINNKYAFIQESVANEYAMDQICELTVIDDEKKYYNREYAIALQRGREDILKMFNDGLRKLKKNGVLDKLKRKYWNKNCMNGGQVANTNAVTYIGLVMTSIISYLIFH